MKLLFDENLSPRLAPLLSVEYPQSAHVRDVGNAGTEVIAGLLKHQRTRRVKFEEDTESSLLILSLSTADA